MLTGIPVYFMGVQVLFKLDEQRPRLSVRGVLRFSVTGAGVVSVLRSGSRQEQAPYSTSYSVCSSNPQTARSALLASSFDRKRSPSR